MLCSITLILLSQAVNMNLCCKNKVAKAFHYCGSNSSVALQSILHVTEERNRVARYTII